MTEQITDSIVWNGMGGTLRSVSDFDLLFDPASLGLNLTSPCTACWRGFIMSLCVEDGLLMIKELKVYCGDGNYPPINGVQPEPSQPFGMYAYRNLNFVCRNYSGTITFQTYRRTPHPWENMSDPNECFMYYALDFKDGRLEAERDITESVLYPGGKGLAGVMRANKAPLLLGAILILIIIVMIIFFAT